MSIVDQITPQPTATQLAAKLAELQAWVGSKVPDIDPTDPVFVATVLTPWVLKLAETENQVAAIEKLVRASSNALSSYPAELHAQIRQFIADRHGVSASSATFASGEVRLTLSSASAPLVIASGTRFFAGNIAFQTTQPWIIQSSSASGVRPLRPTGDGTFVATVPVIAVVAGVSGNIVAQTAMSASTANERIISAAAESNFVGGSDSNSLAWILQSIRSSTFSRTLGTRDQIIAWLQNNPLIGGVSQVGVVGFGDIELRRHIHPFLPLQRAGLADIYLAANYHPVRHTQTLQAVVLSTSPTDTRIHITVGRDVSPGFLEVVSITDNETGKPITVLTHTRGLDLTPTYDQQLPMLTEAYHGGFSAFQTAELVCSLPMTGLAAQSQRSVSVTFLKVAGLDIAQSVVSSRTVRSLAGDTLIRAAIPMFVSVRVSLETQFETLTPDIQAMQTAVSEEIASRPMRAQLTTSDIMRAVLPYLPDDVVATKVMFDARLVLPSGEVRRLTDNSVLSTPIDPAAQLSPRTVAMYCSPSDVQFSYDRVLTQSTP